MSVAESSREKYQMQSIFQNPKESTIGAGEFFRNAQALASTALETGEVMTAGKVGAVIASQISKFPQNKLVIGATGWQLHGLPALLRTAAWTKRILYWLSRMLSLPIAVTRSLK